MTVAAVTVVGMAVMIGLRAYFLAPEGWSTLAPDEAQRAWHALQVNQGRLIYRDLWVQYTPLSFYWHALAFRVLGASLASIRLALVVTGTVTLALISTVAHRLAGARGAVLAGALFLTFGIPSYNSGYPAWEAMAFSMASLCVVMRTASPRSAAAAGALAGLSTMAKINVGVLTMLALVMVVSLQCRRRIRAVAAGVVFLTAAWLTREMPVLEASTQFLIPLALVLCVALSRPGTGSCGPLAVAVLAWAATCAAILLPFAVRMGLGALLHAVVAEPLRFAALIGYSSPMLRLGVVAYVVAACLGAALILPWTRLRPAASAAALAASAALCLDGAGALPAVLVGLRFLLVPVATVAFVMMRKADVGLVAAGVWTVLLHVQIHPSQSNMHVAWALVAGWPWLLGLWRAAAARGGRMIWCVPWALMIAQLAQGAMVMTHTQWTRLDGPRGGIAVPAQNAQELVEVIREVRSAPTASVLDLTSGCLVAFLAEVDCPLRHVYFWRGFLTAADQEAEIAGLSVTPPPLAVRRKTGRAQFRWDAISQYAPILARWVNETYRVSAVIGRYEVLALASLDPGPEGPAETTTR